MGTSYGLRCVNHKSHYPIDEIDVVSRTGAGMLRGDTTLRTLIAMRPHIKAIRDLDTTGYIELDILGGFDGGTYVGEDNHYVEVYLFDWLYQHYNCDVVIYDEYGRDDPFTTDA